MHPEARRLIESLDLAPHPEGGYYRETFRSSLVTQGLPHGESRSASTAIYYLLPAGEFSALHRLRSDEIWHHYDGDPVDLHLLATTGDYRVVRLGRGREHGERPQRVVPAGTWQAAVPSGKRFALCGCTVAPGFDFTDFELASRAELLGQFPAQRAVIASLARA
ncbi:MAG: cupin domain-containing protein [Actinomycetota bacterium]|nr:cupin domain-containing protein [Actinomycetota bacterium]